MEKKGKQRSRACCSSGVVYLESQQSPIKIDMAFKTRGECCCRLSSEQARVSCSTTTIICYFIRFHNPTLLPSLHAVFSPLENKTK
jgi:hypothetical protein